MPWEIGVDVAREDAGAKRASHIVGEVVGSKRKARVTVASPAPA